MRRRLAACALASACWGGDLAAQAPAHLLVVTGLAGEAGYAASFAAAGTTLTDVARTRWGIPAARVRWLAEQCEAAPDAVTGEASRAALAAVLDTIARDSRPGDLVMLVLIGHGSGEGETTRLALPGPDPTAADLRRWLAPLADRRVVVVHAASASGDALAVLAAEGRVVITATRSATERNATTFATHFVHGIASGEADADKDGRLSVLESYDYARRAVAEAYAADGRLQTEHAQFDDTGLGLGTADPGAAEARDGALAARVVLGGERVAADPRVAERLAARRALEADVEALRRDRARYGAEAYAEALEALLVRIAEHTAAIRALERAAGGGTP